MHPRKVNGISVIDDCRGFARGRIVVLGARFRIAGVYWCVVECACGAIKLLRSGNVMNLKCNVSSCGCLMMEVNSAVNTTHGHTLKRKSSPEYNTWRAMISRCDDPDAENYDRYGGRGIRLCQKWKTSFVDFLSDMGLKPTPKHTIDRKDHNGHYEPGNCVWSTNSEQSNNKRNNIRFTFYGITKTATEWSAYSGVDPSMISWRRLHGWPDKDAVWRTASLHHKKRSFTEDKSS